MSITKSSTYVSGLINYILDVKPYHCKLSEVIEEYQFHDNINVHITEIEKFKVKFSTTWFNDYVSDGFRKHWLLPDFYYPRYSIEASRHHFTLGVDELTTLSGKYNLHDAYQLRASRGVESVVLKTVNQFTADIDYESLAEGIDYFVSKGAFSFSLNSPGLDRRWTVTDHRDEPFDLLNNYYSSTHIHRIDKDHPYNVDTFGNITHQSINLDPIDIFSRDKPGSIVQYLHGSNAIVLHNNVLDPTDPDNLVVNFGKYNQESYDITCITEPFYYSNFNTFTFNIPAMTWNIQHDLNTSDLCYFVYVKDSNGIFQLDFTNTITIIDKNTIKIEFLTNKTGYVKISPANKIWTITHNFRTSNLLWEVYIIDSVTGNFTKILPTVEFLDANKLTVNFSSPQIGFIKLIAVPDAFIFPIQRHSANAWKIDHKFNTKNLIVQMYILDEFGMYQPVLPNKIEIVDYRSIKISSSIGTDAKIIIMPTNQENTLDFYNSATWTINFSDLDLIYSIEKIPVLAAFTSTLTGNLLQIAPQSQVIIENGEPRIELTFSQPITGFISITSPATEYLYSVTDSHNNFLGFSSYHKRFSIPNLSFTLDNQIARLGDSLHIGRQPYGISVHPAAPTETWSLIKVNPISYGNFHFFSKQTMKLIAIMLESYKGNEATWTITCIGVSPLLYTFHISARLLSDNSELLITSPTISIPINELADVIVDDYLKLTFYPKKKPVKVGDSCTFTLGYEGSIYDTKPYDYDSKLPTPHYENWVTDPKLLDFYDTLQYEGADEEEFYYDLAPYVASIVGAKPTIKLLPLGSAYGDAIPETWTIEYVEATRNFKVIGSVSGQTEPAYLGKEYDNGLIRFRIVATGELFDVTNSATDYLADYLTRALQRGDLLDEDMLTFDILNERPNYLVHGSITGYTAPAVVGQYYWNGKIGFQLDLPYYLLSTSQRVIGQARNGTLSFPDAGSITFNSAPKFDADFEQFEFTYHAVEQKIGVAGEHYTIQSSLRGSLPLAVVGQRYYDIETANRTIDRNNIVDLTIAPECPVSFKIDIIANPFKLFHSEEVLLLPFNSEGEVYVNTFREDTFTFEIKSAHPELGSTSAIVQTYLTNSNNDPKIPDRGFTQDVWLTNANNVKVGILTREFDDTVSALRHTIVFDDDFFNAYLPINTAFTVKVEQSDLYNELLKVKIGERFSMVEACSFDRDKINIELAETKLLTTVLTNHDSVISNLIEFPPIGGYNPPVIGTPWPPYDIVPYDLGVANFSTIVKESTDGTATVGTSVSDFGLSIITKYLGDEQGYDLFGYDLYGFDGVEGIAFGKSVFFQLPAYQPILTNPGPFGVQGTEYTNVVYSEAVWQVILELPDSSNCNFIVLAENNVALRTTQDPGEVNPECIITQLPTANAKPTFQFNVLYSRPITIVAFR